MVARSIVSVGLVACVAACSSPASAPSAPATPVAPEPAAAAPDKPELPPVPAPRKAPILLAKKPGELGRVALDADWVLRAGVASVAIEKEDAEAYHFQQATLTVVLFNATQHAVLLSTPTAEEEDPPNRHRLYLVAGDKMRLVFDQTLGVYGVTQLSVPGDGTVSYVEDGWTACNRTKHPQAAAKQRVTFKLPARSSRMVESSRADTADKQICNNLAACPFVYVVDGDREIFVGEILRNVRGRAAYTSQSLAMPLASAAGTTAVVRIKEEKLETTFLDSIRLNVDGVLIAPLECRGDTTLAYCVADRAPHVMRQGDVLELRFALPAGANAASASLVATGFYIPTPTVHTRGRR